MRGQNRLVAVLMAVGSTVPLRGCFALHCTAVRCKRVTSPGSAERSRGRTGVKAAHTRAASRSQSLDTGLCASAHNPYARGDHPENIVA